ncbi:MAG: hypothetical protein P8P74_04535 [Crocinitomicaceae bacterium]|nr:hypothetical protein [Crocinitomicaceae bacterium]
MRRVVALGAFVLIGVGVIALLIIKPWEEEVQPPRFLDRLPMDDIIGRTNVLNLSRDLIPTTYNNQISFREFISPEFILSQGKTNGLNLQRPVYFFGNENNLELEKWGVMIHVSDSSKVYGGITRFDKITELKDSTLFDQRIFIFPEYNITVAYGKDWLLLSDRKSFKKYFDHVYNARIKSIYPRWRRFIEEKMYSEKSLQVSVISKELRKYGVESALIASSSDSLSLTLHARVTNIDTIPFALKDSGERFEQTEFTRRLINLHLNIDRLKEDTDHPLYAVLAKAARKISFPLSDFLETWNGDITYRQGGLQTIVEPYIVSELDENFNITEVVKYKQKKISGFALQMSMGDNRPEFIRKLYSKGILTREENKVRMLYFPPMKMLTDDESVSFYTSSFQPATIADSTQSVLWDFNYTPVLFTIDSLESKVAYGKINIGLTKFLKDKLKQE